MMPIQHWQNDVGNERQRIKTGGKQNPSSMLHQNGVLSFENSNAVIFRYTEMLDKSTPKPCTVSHFKNPKFILIIRGERILR